MKLSDVHIALMEHCIGLDNHKPYRRHGKLFFLAGKRQKE